MRKASKVNVQILVQFLKKKIYLTILWGRINKNELNVQFDNSTIFL